MEFLADAVHISGVVPQVIPFRGILSSNVLVDVVINSVPRVYPLFLRLSTTILVIWTFTALFSQRK